MRKKRDQSQQVSLAGGAAALPALPSFPNGEPAIGGPIEFMWVMDDQKVQQLRGTIIDIRQLIGGVGYPSVTDDDQRRLAFAAVLGYPLLFIVEIPTIRECRRAA